MLPQTSGGSDHRSVPNRGGVRKCALRALSLAFSAGIPHVIDALPVDLPRDRAENSSMVTAAGGERSLAEFGSFRRRWLVPLVRRRGRGQSMQRHLLSPPRRCAPSLRRSRHRRREIE